MRILCFGIAREVTEKAEIQMDTPMESVGALRAYLNESYPGLLKIGTYMLAVNETYAMDEEHLQASDVVAIIPPVSGG